MPRPHIIGINGGALDQIVEMRHDKLVVCALERIFFRQDYGLLAFPRTRTNPDGHGREVGILLVTICQVVIGANG